MCCLLVVSVLQKWLENMRTRYSKLISTKSGQEAKQLTERDKWIKQTFSLRSHIVRCPTRASKVSTISFSNDMSLAGIP